MAKVERVKTIAAFHLARQLPPPEHPLISVVNYADVQLLPEHYDQSWVFDFYFISLKRNIGGRINYGQQQYDFDEGVLFFIAPGQVFGIGRSPEGTGERSGWMLLVHPDFLWQTSLAKGIRQYDYFDYAINEALFVAQKEETILAGIIAHIRQEYHSNIDKFSQHIIVSHIETLLNYAARFYNRQFITRKKTNDQLLNRLEELLDQYFDQEALVAKGLPGVAYLADNLHVSPKYLSSLLKVLTGLTAQQHIHEKLIGRAKAQLSTTELSISEIAYGLGFEHAQSFSKLFKAKTDLSPQAFRASFASGH